MKILTRCSDLVECWSRNSAAWMRGCRRGVCNVCFSPLRLSSVEFGFISSLALSVLASFSTPSSPFAVCSPSLRPVSFSTRQENRPEKRLSCTSCVSLLFEYDVYIRSDMYSLLSRVIRACAALLCVNTCLYLQTNYSDRAEGLRWLWLRWNKNSLNRVLFLNLSFWLSVLLASFTAESIFWNKNWKVASHRRFFLLSFSTYLSLIYCLLRCCYTWMRSWFRLLLRVTKTEAVRGLLSLAEALTVDWQTNRLSIRSSVTFQKQDAPSTHRAILPPTIRMISSTVCSYKSLWRRALAKLCVEY